MGTALQTQNPRVSGVLASILHEAPVGLCRARSRRWTNRMREREICIHRFGTRKTYTMRWKEEQRTEYVDLVMGQCASVTIRYCVRAHCSRLFFLRARHVPRWHPWVLGSFGYLPSHAEDRGEKKIARISSRVVQIARIILLKFVIAWKEEFVSREKVPVNPSKVDYRMTGRITTFVNGLNTRPRELR